MPSIDTPSKSDFPKANPSNTISRFTRLILMTIAVASIPIFQIAEEARAQHGSTAKESGKNSPGVASPPADVPQEECSCEKISSVTSARELSEAVFSGRVTAIKQLNKNDSEVHFQVLQYWKGEGKRTTVLSRSNLFKGACNYPFEKGVEYLVFVDQTSLDVYRERFIPSARPIFNATKCNRTTVLTQAQDELDVLGLGEFPEKE